MRQAEKINLLKNLINVNIKDIKKSGAEKLSEMVKNIQKKESDWEKKGKFYSNLLEFAGKASGFPMLGEMAGKSVDYTGRKYFDKGARPSDLYIPREERIFGVGKAFDTTSGGLERYLEDKTNIYTLLGNLGGSFFGEKATKGWEDEGMTGFLEADVSESGLGDIMKLITSITGATNYQNGGFVPKYKEGDFVQTREPFNQLAQPEGNNNEDTIASGLQVYEENGQDITAGKRFAVKTGSTYKKWYWKEDPYTGFRFKEYTNAPYFQLYKYNMDTGRPEKVGGSKQKGGGKKGRDVRKIAEPNVTTLEALETRTTRGQLETASGYIGESGILFKRDRETAALIKRAQEGDESAYTTLALLAVSGRSELKDRPLEDIVNAIKTQIKKIDIDVGMEGVEMKGLTQTFEEGKETLASTLRKDGTNIYKTPQQIREEKRKRKTISEQLSESYSAYGTGQEEYLSSEFGTLDTLFASEDLG